MAAIKHEVNIGMEPYLGVVQRANRSTISVNLGGRAQTGGVSTIWSGGQCLKGGAASPGARQLKRAAAVKRKSSPRPNHKHGACATQESSARRARASPANTKIASAAIQAGSITPAHKGGAIRSQHSRHNKAPCSAPILSAPAEPGANAGLRKEAAPALQTMRAFSAESW